MTKKLPSKGIGGVLSLEPLRAWWAGASGWQRWAVYMLLIMGGFLLPSQAIGSFMAPSGQDWPAMLSDQIAIYVLLAIGLNVVVGMAGLLDLGFVAFYAVGGYTMAIFAVRYGWSFWGTLVLGLGFAAVSGLILGAPTLRLRGDYLAIVTLGFGEIVKRTANNSEFVNGPRGVQGIPHPPSLSEFEIFGVQPLSYGILDSRPYYYLLLLFIIIAIIFVKRLERSRVGRAWTSIREDEDAAELMGVPTFKFKLAAFVIGAAIGSSAGVVFASKQSSILPTNFEFMVSALVLSAVVLGGSGNIPGAVLGAFVVAWLPERFRFLEDYRMLIFGAALVLMMVFRPEGLWPSRRRKAELSEGGGGMGRMGAEVGEQQGEAVPEGGK